MQVGSVLFEGGTDRLHCQFRVHKTWKPDFNSKELTVYNLKPETRKKLSGVLPISIEAGTFENSGLLFRGHTRIIDHIRDRGSWITKIQAGDGYLAGKASTYQSFAPGTPVSVVVEKLLKDSGLNAGTVKQQLSATLRQGWKEYKHGFTVNGNTLRALDKLVTSSGKSWSIQDGTVQVMSGRRAVYEGEPPLVTEATGLIGSPHHKVWKPNWPTFICFQSILRHDLRCGGAAFLSSEQYSRLLTLMEVTHTGDTHGNDWQTACEGI